jgi:hypothetical protein
MKKSALALAAVLVLALTVFVSISSATNVQPKPFVSTGHTANVHPDPFGSTGFSSGADQDVRSKAPDQDVRSVPNQDVRGVHAPKVDVRVHTPKMDVRSRTVPKVDVRAATPQRGLYARSHTASACRSGIMAGGGSYSGTVPYYVSNSYVQLRTTITNVNLLGFVGYLSVYTYSNSKVSTYVSLLPYGSTSVTGPTYTTPFSNTKGVPFRLDLTAYSSAVALAYQVCV